MERNQAKVIRYSNEVTPRTSELRALRTRFLGIVLLMAAAPALVGVATTEDLEGMSAGSPNASAAATLGITGARQRPDATKLVEIAYELTGESETYEISFEISDNSGATFYVPGGVRGDIGTVVPDPYRTKRVFWDPAVDHVPSGDYTLRISSPGISSDEVALYVAAPQTGSLTGHVLLADDGTAVSGAAVLIDVGTDPPATTGPDGSFPYPEGLQFTTVPAGEVVVSVDHFAIYPIRKKVTVREASTTHVVLIARPRAAAAYSTSAAASGVAEVVDVRSRYSDPSRDKVYFLDGVELDEEFTATIDWCDNVNGRQVRWETDWGPIVLDASGDQCTVTLDMGFHFQGDGELQVVAICDGKESAPVTANFRVIDPPTGILNHLLYDVPYSNDVKYVTPSLKVNPDIAGGYENLGDDPPPVFDPENKSGLGKIFQIATAFDLSAEVNLDGTATGPQVSIPIKEEKSEEFQLGKTTKMGGYSFQPKVNVQLSWLYSEEDLDWHSGAHVSVAANLAITAPVPPPPIPGLPFPTYVRGKIDLSVNAEFDIDGWTAPGGPSYAGSLGLRPLYVEANVGAGLADLAAVEGYLGGGANTEIGFPGGFSGDVFVAGGVRFILYLFVKDFPALEYKYPSSAVAGQVAGGVDVNSFRRIPRDYLTPAEEYAQFTATAPGDTGLCNNPLILEGPVQSNVFSRSTAQVAVVGNNLLAVWVYDEPGRSDSNRSRLYSSKATFDSLQGTWTWSTPSPVANDSGTADFNPRLAVMPNGNAILVWESVNAVLAEPSDPQDDASVLATYEDMKGKVEITAARFDGSAWSTPGVLTGNSYLDRGARIAAAPSDSTAMLTWVSNTANEEVGTNQPDAIKFRLYDDSVAWPGGWGAVGDVATSAGAVVKNVMAFDGNEAVLVFSEDTDGDVATGEDRELTAISYDGTSWSNATRLTTNGVDDADPSVVFHEGVPTLIWTRHGSDTTDAELHMVTLDLAGATPIIDSTVEVMTFDQDRPYMPIDPRLAMGSNGEMALVWSDASEQRVDLWYSIRGMDPTLPADQQAWSIPAQLTCDASVEQEMTPVFTPAGDLLVMYDKVATLYESRDVDGITVDNIPVPDRTDLYVLLYKIGNLGPDVDLEVRNDDLSIEPAHAREGEPATITANVRNLSLVPSLDFGVAFYAGDPNADGSLISEETVSGPFVFGREQTVTAQWTAVAPVDIHVVVEPNDVQQDRSDANNRAVLTLGEIDVLPETMFVQTAGSKLVLTIRILNDGPGGSVPAGLDISIRDGNPNGDELTSLVVPKSIPSGAYYDLSWTWDSPKSTRLFAVVDADGSLSTIEPNRDNNVRSLTVEWTDGACCTLEGICLHSARTECSGVFQGVGTFCGTCSNSPNTGCFSNADCPACVGGTFDGRPCATSSECPGGACSGTATCDAASPCVSLACCDASDGSCYMADQLCTGNLAPCWSDADCLAPSVCEVTSCPASTVPQGLGSTCDPNCCERPNLSGGNTCDTAPVINIAVPPAGDPPVTVTVAGDNRLATPGDFPDTCPIEIFDTTAGSGDPGWWEAFHISACANVRIDFCCTEPALQPQWSFLIDECPCNAVTIRNSIVDPPVGHGTVSSGRGAPFCNEDNLWVTYGPLPAGTYYQPIYSAPDGTLTQYQMHITVAACPQAACCVGESCSVTDVLTCDAMNGYWLGGSNVPGEPVVDCVTGACYTGSCCLWGDYCDDDTGGGPMTESACSSWGGRYVGGPRCDYPLPACPTCEIQDPSNCQMWEDSSIALSVSDLSTPGGASVRADDFIPIDTTLNRVCVWGAYLDGRNASGTIATERFDCAAGVYDNFTVTVYGDAGGMPGTVLGTSTVNNVFRGPALGTHWQDSFNGAGVMYSYQLELDSPIAGLTPGVCHWLEVANNTASPDGEAPNTCIWMWSAVETSGNRYSFAGTHNGAQGIYQPGGARLDDMAFCIDGGMAPGACLSMTAACCECDAATGVPTGTCDVLSLDDCQWLGWSWDSTALDCPGAACSGGAPGDDCASGAIVVTGNSVSIPFDTTCTTTDGPIVMPSELGNIQMGKDIWVAYTASCSGTVTASMCSVGSQFDSAIEMFFDPDNPHSCICPGTDSATVYEGNNEGCTGYNDRGAGYVSRIATGGECMLIRVGGFEGDRGVGVLNIDCVPPPCLSVPPPVVHPVRHSFGHYVPASNNRFLSIEAGDAGRTQAIRVTFVSLPPPYDVWNGAQMFVSEPSQLSEFGSIGIGDPVEDWWDFINIAPLGCDPLLADFGSMGPIHIYHEGIVPGGVYDVQAVDSTCEMAVESSYSQAATIVNARWADVVGAYNSVDDYWGAYDDSVDVATDVVAMIEKFASTPHAPSKFIMDLEPRLIDGKINITDVTVTLDAFSGETYPFSPSMPDPCP